MRALLAKTSNRDVQITVDYSTSEYLSNYVDWLARIYYGGTG